MPGEGKGCDMSKTKTEEKELTTQEKLAKSSGAETDKYAAELEDEADDMINKRYHPEKFEADQKAKKEAEDAEAAKLKEEEADATEEKPTEEEKKAEAEDTEKAVDEKKDEAVVDVEEEITSDDDDTIARLKEKLLKSEQRVKETRTVYSKSQKDLKAEKVASNAITERFTETIEKLQSGLDQKSEAGTRQEEKVADAEIKESVVDLKEQFDKLNNIDPDIAAPIKEIIQGLTGKITGLNGQISSLKTEIKTKEDNANKTAQEIVDEAHYGAIDKAHPDNAEIFDSVGFEDYLSSLSPRHERLARQDIKDGSAENIIELFNDYKKEIGITSEETEEPDTTTTTDAKAEKMKRAAKMVAPNLDKSKEVKTSKRVKFTRAMIREEVAKDPTWFERNEAEIDKELAAGNIR